MTVTDPAVAVARREADHSLGNYTSTMTPPVLNRGIRSGQRSQGNAERMSDLKKIVGARHVLTTPPVTSRFRKGFRFGNGLALAVVSPGSLVEMWRSLRVCSEAGKIVLMQAANTEDPLEVEHEMWRILDRQGAEYPAEHNVGRLYYGKPSLVNHYRSLDSSNSCNPGIRYTSKLAYWKGLRQTCRSFGQQDVE